MRDDENIEPVLVGVKPWLMGEILFLLLLVIPLGIIEGSVPDSHFLGVDIIVPKTYGLFWIFNTLQIDLNTLWFSYEFLMLTVLTLILDTIFVLVIIGFYKGLFSRRILLVVSVLSFLIPAITIGLTSGLIREGAGYVGPLPILQIIGALMVFRVPGPTRETWDTLSNTGKK
ncbi:MAG: hypothetical protein ACFFEV_04805 [Candidatus Thorarchaeota archaeon]